MSRTDLSYLVWGAGWLGLFLILELLPRFWKGCPWEMLSNTSWDAESAHHWLKAILLGFLVGLLIHIVYRVPFWSAMVFGQGFALLTHLLHLRKGT